VLVVDDGKGVEWRVGFTRGEVVVCVALEGKVGRAHGDADEAASNAVDSEDILLKWVKKKGGKKEG